MKDAETLAAALLASHRAADAIEAAYNFNMGTLVRLINIVEGETKARLLGLVSDVAALLRRDSRWVLPQ